MSLGNFDLHGVAGSEQNHRQRLFVDMDGTLAVFTPVNEFETLYEKGYFLSQAPHENVVAAIQEIIEKHPDIEVNILSAYLTDSKYALQEKNEWLDRYLPQIAQEHRIFVPCGSDKKAGIEDGIRTNDFLLDDYSVNLFDWQPPARGIKLLNSVNHTRGSWPHDRIRFDREPSDLARAIVSVMRDERRIYDEKVSDEKSAPAQTASQRKSVRERIAAAKVETERSKQTQSAPHHSIPKKEQGEERTVKPKTKSVDRER